MNDQLAEILSSEVFVDTNILFYAVNSESKGKHTKAADVLEFLWQRTTLPTISTQILQEFYVTLVRNKIDLEEAQKVTNDYYVWNVVPATTMLIDAAFAMQKRYLLSFWDSLVLAAAQQAHCTYLLTEDLNHGQKFGKITAINPFHRNYEN